MARAVGVLMAVGISLKYGTTCDIEDRVEMMRTCAGQAAPPMHALHTCVSIIATARDSRKLTLAGQALSVDGCTDDHNVVHDRKTALAADEASLLVPYSAICEDGSLVHGHPLLMKFLRIGQLFWREEIPRRLIDDFIRSVSEDVYYGVGGVEDAGVRREVYEVKLATGHTLALQFRIP